MHWGEYQPQTKSNLPPKQIHRPGSFLSSSLRGPTYRKNEQWLAGNPPESDTIACTLLESKEHEHVAKTPSLSGTLRRGCRPHDLASPANSHDTALRHAFSRISKRGDHRSRASSLRSPCHASRTSSTTNTHGPHGRSISGISLRPQLDRARKSTQRRSSRLDLVNFEHVEMHVDEPTSRFSPEQQQVLLSWMLDDDGVIDDEAFLELLMKPKTVPDVVPLVVKSIADARTMVAHSSSTSHTLDLCTVCLEEYDPGHNISILPCSHVYHEACLSRWFATCPNRHCPVCRQGQVDQ